VTATDAPEQLVGITVGEGPRFELFVYVDDVDMAVAAVRANDAPVLKQPEDMFRGERVAWIVDPEGNPVALAAFRDAGRFERTSMKNRIPGVPSRSKSHAANLLDRALRGRQDLHRWRVYYAPGTGARNAHTRGNPRLTMTVETSTWATQKGL